MNHSKTAKAKRSKCNLKQSDIFSAFENWKAIKKEKDMKRAALYDKIIEVEDSDPEEIVVSKVPKKKRPLAQLFSDNEEEKSDLSSLSLGNKPTPKTKRNLRHSFFDSEDETIEKSPFKACELMHPMACSTPFSSQQFSTPETLNSPHVGIEDIFNISAIKNEPDDDNTSNLGDTVVIEHGWCQNNQTVQVKELVSIQPATDDSTIVAHSHNRTIQIKEHIIIPPPGTNKQVSNGHITEFTNNNDKQVNTGMKRCVEEDRNAKKQKTQDSVSDCSQSNTPRWLSKKDRLFEYRTKNSDGTPKTITENLSTEEKMKERKGTDFKSVRSEKCALKQVKVTEPLKKSSSDDKNGNKTTGSRDLNHNKISSLEENTESTDKNPIQMNESKQKTSPNQSRSEVKKTLPSSSKRNESTQGKDSPIKKEKSMNTQPLKLITDLFKKVFASRHISNIPGTERSTIRTFLDMNTSYQYVCFKLITWKRKWYNAHKFCRLIHVDLEETEIAEIVGVFKRHGIIDTDYLEDSPMQLLPRLDNTDLRGICDKFRLKKTLKNKENMIQSLLKYANTQSTLTVNKTTKDLLMEEIHARMGKCMRVNESFWNTFQSVYLLGTFPNPRFATMNEYIASVLGHNVVFPKVRIDEYTIFASGPDFLRFAKAKQYRNVLDEITDPVVCLQICRTIFDELRGLEDDRSADLFQEAPHLVRFTAKAVYVGALSAKTETLFCKFPEDVRAWLEYMIANVECSHKVGRWYYHLVWLYMKYLKPLNYDRAAELLVEVLQDKGHHLSQLQLYQLRKRGEQLICTKKYKILQINHDRIVELLPKRIRTNEFPETTVDAKTIRSNELGLKRNYEMRDQEGNKTILRVEEIALDYYLTEMGYTGGEHCEGALVKATFTLFFFDIIYSETRSIPGTFVSDLQSEPLDMNSRYFYSNRREEIDKRLKEIESEWSDAHLMKFLKENYNKHSHEFTVCEVGRVIPDSWLLEVIVECVGRQVLAKIYERLVQNFREFRSGLPDLLVWNVDTKQCKFVEVKGENDRLSVGQTLWLDYLRKIGAPIEVCHVHSIGSKRKVKKVVTMDEEPSTSSSPD